MSVADQAAGEGHVLAESLILKVSGPADMIVRVAYWSRVEKTPLEFYVNMP